jgi:4-hydroxy-4-methyl-2-oxoglutarate aldolase
MAGKLAPIVKDFDSLVSTYSLTAVVADCQERMGIMHSNIKPIDPSTKMIGIAVTVELTPGDLQDPLGALDHVIEGSVVVINAHSDTEVSVFGGLMGSLFKLKGARGVVVDGACRDTDENRDLGIPVFSRSVTPRGTHTMFSGRKDDVSYGIPVVCGGVLVNPGDIVIGDEMGVVVVNRERSSEIYEAARAQADREEATREKIRAGWTVQQILDEFGRI